MVSATHANMMPNPEEDLLSLTHDANKAQVLDHNARMYFELGEQASSTNLYSFYSEYTEYLEDRNLVDPDQFAEKAERAAKAELNKKEQATAKGAEEAQTNAAGAGGATLATTGGTKAVNVDEENISGPEDQSEASNIDGGHRFENLIKSMLARLELNGSLAPIQQFGRH